MRIDEVNATVAVYHTIREAAKITGLSEYYIRQQVKAGVAPGVYSGNRFMVDVPSLVEYARTSTKGVTENDQ